MSTSPAPAPAPAPAAPPASFLLFSRSRGAGLSRSNPSVMLSATYAHSLYWLWYNLDFNPFLQSAGFDVDTRIGLLGGGLALFMNGAAATYATHLVKDVQLRNNVLRVRRHGLPFGLPQKEEDATLFRVGEVLVPPEDSGSTMVPRGGGGEGVRLGVEATGVQPLKIQDKEKQGWKLSYLLDIDNGEFPVGTELANAVLVGGRQVTKEQLVAGMLGSAPEGLGEKKRERWNPAKERRKKRGGKRKEEGE
ncbi:hypothetical protein TeGR_g13422 [Tetraparma gracilis]|uniref:Uncharacterized protein n=1 Tax=Tetraparma gracilis TaxID=2962635 RepID=A0ABQ6N252_9STRA|nr:hypothetical protein TeGR_g13422 [Tetraparma gracilis]